MDTSEVRCNDLLTNMQSQCKQPFDTNNQLDMGMLSELLARVYNVSAELQKQQQQQQQQQAAQLAIQNFQSNNQQHIIPTMTVTPTTNSGLTSESATLQQQLDWAKACNTMLTPTTMYPLHQTSATSTTEIAPSRCESERTSKRGQCCSRGCNTIVLDTSLQSPQRSSSRSATCLCARQQAKQRKMAQFMN
ncbi:unnamed protein product [Ceratitis capitata]|uniref:(Mediterranean fruit fly) hypothetical protein n=4 Tax=Ceratitis capitata TaxID=7213 RepID=A0A811UCY3_CERCA|nr:unnamed protein product [Ceratitis capitata]